MVTYFSKSAHIIRVHKFSWHGRDPKDPSNKAALVPGTNNFTKLPIIPSHFYYNVSEVTNKKFTDQRQVRTSDDTLLTTKFMIFYELVNLELMLEQTSDPIGDIKNALCAGFH